MSWCYWNVSLKKNAIFVIYTCYSTVFLSSLHLKNYSSRGVVDQYANVDWVKLGYGIIPTDYMYMMKCFKEENFLQGKLIPYGNIELIPSAGVLNYGQVRINNNLILLIKLTIKLIVLHFVSGTIWRSQSI